MSQHPFHTGYPGQPQPFGDAYQTVQQMQPGGQQMQPAAFPPGTSNPAGLLNPPGFANYAQAPNVRWIRIPAHLPQIGVPDAEFITIKPFDIVNTFSGNAANAAYTQTVQFPEPCTIFAVTAAVIDTAGGAFPVGLDPLDAFTIALTRTNSDKLQSSAGLGSTICGTAQRPRYVGPSGWVQDRGSSIQVVITPLRASLRIDLVFWTAVTYGPTAFTLRGG